MLKIRRPLGRLIFNMGIAIPGKTVFLIETAPCHQERHIIVTTIITGHCEIHPKFSLNSNLAKFRHSIQLSDCYEIWHQARQYTLPWQNSITVENFETSPCSRRHFQINFLVWKLFYFESHFHKICSQWTYGPISNNPSLIQSMAWRRTGYMPLSEPVVVQFTLFGLSELLNTITTVPMV